MKSYWRLLTYLRPYLFTVAIAVVLNLIVASLQGISVWVGAEFIERILSGRTTETLPTSGMALIASMDGLARVLLQRATPFGTVIAGTITLVSARLIIGGLRIVKMVLIARVNQSILARIRNDLFECITRVDLAFSQKTRPGEVATIFIKDVDQLNEALFDAVDRAILHPFRLILIFLLMLGQSVMLTLWVLAFMLVGGVVIHYSGGRIQRLCAIALERISQLQGHLTEYLSTAMLARFMSREKMERRRFNQVSHSISNMLVRIVFMRNLAPQLVRSLFSIAGGVLLIIGGYHVFVLGSLTSGTLLKMVLLLPMAVISIEALSSLYMAQRVTIASTRRVFNLMDSATPVQDAPDAVTIDALREGIVFDNVSLDLNGETILKSISLTIPAGAKVAISGPSGSGKSTLLALLAGIYHPSQGTISIDGLDMRAAKLSNWRKMLGVVLQESIMINGTVRDNLTYGAPLADDPSLEKVLNIVQLGPQSGALTKGVATPVGNRGDLLSGGERQRLAIARALLTDPPILLMDEPTSMLDDANKQSVINAIWNAAQNRTLVLVTHDHGMAHKADVQFTLKKGRLA